MRFRHFALAAVCVAALTLPAFADTTVTVLHVSDNADQKAVWNKIAQDYNAEHKGVKVEFKYLENEAFKAKLPTMLQSSDRPDLFYSWSGGVMQAQDKAGFLKDITADVASVESAMSPTAVDAFKVDGKAVGVPFEVGEVAFYYNKKLFEKAGVKAEDIKTWDDFLGAVKKLKAAGIVPDRRSGRARNGRCISTIPTSSCASAASTRSPTPRRGRTEASRVRPSSRRASACASWRRSSRSSPAISRPPTPKSSGIFGDGKAAMDLMGQWLLQMQGPNSASGKGLPEEDIGILSFPIVPGGKGKATDTLGGINGWLVTKTAPPEAVDFLKFFSQPKYAQEAAAHGGYIPVVKGVRSLHFRPAGEAPG